jgi:uncharacterized protein (TIGR04255 family)
VPDGHQWTGPAPVDVALATYRPGVLSGRRTRKRDAIQTRARRLLQDGFFKMTRPSEHGSLSPLCNLYSITKGPQAIRDVARAFRDTTGNLPPLPGVFPDYAAPIVRNAPYGERELMMARWGMPSPAFALKGSNSDPGVTNVRNVASPHWRRWLGVESRCVVPFNGSERADCRGQRSWAAILGPPFHSVKNARYNYEMSAQRSYRRPPVAEAAIEMRFENPIHQPDLERAAGRLETEYPISETEVAQSINVDTVAGAATFSTAWQGVKRSSRDRTDVVILRSNAVIVAQLAPYRGWEHLFGRLKNAWASLSRTTRENIGLSRLGIRYINRIDIPVADADGASFFDYLRFHPQAPEGLIDKAPLSEFSAHVAFPISENDLGAKLVMAKAISPLLSHNSILLDIDVFREGNVPRKADEIWDVLSAMRGRKNMIFEMCITDKARELFDR